MPTKKRLCGSRIKKKAILIAAGLLLSIINPLVFKVAMRWQLNDPAMFDLIQEGTVGLIEAVENYDYSRGVAFSLYAFHRIRGRILNYLAKEGSQSWLYIDSPASEEDGDLTLGDYLIDGSTAVAAQAEQNFLVEQVKSAMGRLPAKEQLVLNCDVSGRM